MDRLKRAQGQEQIYETAIELRTREQVFDILRDVPKYALEDLKKEGDEIYG
jgi:hypothetical protein